MNRRARNLSLSLAVTAVAALGVSAQARAATGMEVATQDDPLFVQQAYKGLLPTEGFALADELHVTWLKVNVTWSNVVKSSAKSKSKPSTVTYDWNSYDALVTAARTRGINVQMSLTGPAPAWAAGDKKIGPTKPNATYFGEFAREAALHFRGLVTRYSIYNEPNHIGWIKPLKSQASIYAALYKNGYNAVKGADPSAEVLWGELAPYASRKGVATAPLAFLRAATKAGGVKAQGFAHHPYDFDHAPTFKFPGKDNVTLSGLSKLTKELDKLARNGKLSTDSGKPLDLVLTEYGYFGSGKRKMPESKRAKYIPQAFEIAFKNKRVKQMLHFLLAKPTSKYLFFDTSIVSQGGSKTPTFKALAKWASDKASKGQIATR
jgi:hypothetical protein